MSDYQIKTGISNALIKLRKSKGLNQTEAGAIVGVPKTTYATWEQGRSMPDAETLYKLAKYYNVSMDEIYGVKSKIIRAILTEEHSTQINVQEAKKIIDDVLSKEPKKIIKVGMPKIGKNPAPEKA